MCAFASVFGVNEHLRRGTFNWKSWAATRSHLAALED